MTKYNLEIAAFIVGAIVMILEIVGSRILAPYLGISIYVWSSLIGIILGSLSLGYWWGGRLADRKSEKKILSNLIFISAFFIGLTVLIKTPVLLLIATFIPDIRLGSLIAVTLLFAPATIFLATVTPYIIKLKSRTLEKTGSTTGNLFAVSTLGSIFGTFAAGFVLISFLGSTNILLLLVFTLIFTSLLIYPHRLSKFRIFFVIFFIAISIISWKNTNSSGVIEIDTQYSHVVIYDSLDPETERPIRSLMTSAEGIQSKIFLDDEFSLPTTYQNYFRLVRHFNPSLKKTLLLGGGAYSFANNFLHENPSAELDVVEIDSELTEIARQYFNLKDDPRLNIYHQDARRYINNTDNTYDAIIVDVFFSLAVPYQITTIEAVERLHSILNEDGVVMLNLVSTANGNKGKFLQAEYKTYMSVFPQVYLLATEDSKNGDVLQNFILVALKSDAEPFFESLDPDFNDYLATLWKENIDNDVPILTDDFAPVEQYVIGNLKKRL